MNTTEADDTTNAIAIIAMNGRFPGAKNIDEFWQNLCNGVESITHFSNDELLAAGVDQEQINNPYYVKARGILEDVELLDAAFFRFNPREAQITDPQQRLFLECCWEALETAGYSTDLYTGKIGVYAGVSISTYLLRNLASNLELLEATGLHQAMIGNDKDFLAPLVAYKLDLKGPGVTIQTGCSTSLVATHLACQALLNYQCDIALAGGSTLQLPQVSGYMYEESGISSPEGRCRAFDAHAQGTVGGNGVGVVVLKRLEDALANRDQIYAVIRGSAINNDGSAKVGFTAPSIEGQCEVIAEAHASAQVDPSSITYVETHGTGTMLGDPIEFTALTRAFRFGTQEKQFCAIGSVKTNVGHLDSAAGIVGLMKTALALKYKYIPPSLHFETPNPAIDFPHSPFYVNTKLSVWKSGPTPRRAGVSSFGIGGTNAHMVLEEAPEQTATDMARPWQLLPISAKSESALDVATTNLATFLKKQDSLANVAYTLQVGRKQFSHRRIAVCQSAEDAAQVLETLETARVFTAFQETKGRPVIFMFPGGGSQYINMGKELYQQEPRFRDVIDRCADLLKLKLQMDIRNVLYPQSGMEEQAKQMMRKTSTGLSALFICEYALAQLWQSWGIHPHMMIGHSMGEYTAACLAGVFSLEDALSLVVLRGQLFEQLPAGSMLSVALPEKDVLSLLNEELSIAAINGPNLCVVSGSVKAIHHLEQTLRARGVDLRPVHIDVAAHSSLLEPIIAPFTEFVRTCELQKPSISYISNVTGTWITEEEATDPVYWGTHLRQTVRFSAGLQHLRQDTDAVFLEVGPGNALSSLVKQYMSQGSGTAVLASLRHPYDTQPDQAFLLTTVGRLWLEGVSVDWTGFSVDESRRRVAVPTYPFERQPYWIHPRTTYPDFKVLQDIQDDTTKQEPGDFIPFKAHAGSRRHYVAPTNEVEKQLVEIWQQLLGIEAISIHDNFFEMGGHSLLGTQLVTRVRDTFHISLPLRALFEQATVAELALVVMQYQAELLAGNEIERMLADLENLSEAELQAMLNE